eukprot:TRINITY_DN10357_c0_g1_i1.p1 TRINITY_DN10357_c0_g1~~TRINITY_DN10357_c0_g1_i1.p1  ORF type:complete len:152 (+),score=56.66 TRINITY_DN10357_c0_g1_i1:51-458(+)
MGKIECDDDTCRIVEDDAEQVDASVRTVARDSAFAAAYMLVVRWAAGLMMGISEADPEERANAGRASALMVGFVLIFHRLKGPKALGIPLALLQLFLLLAYYIAGSTAVWGPDDLLQMVNTVAQATGIVVVEPEL